MASLFELTGEYLRAYDAIDTEEYDEDSLIGILEDIQEDIGAKADSYAALIRTLKSEADALKQEEARIHDKRVARENLITRLKDSLTCAMKLTGNLKFKTLTNNFWIQKNPIGVKYEDWVEKEADELPERFQKIVVQADKEKIREALEDGEDLEFAWLRQTDGVRIR